MNKIENAFIKPAGYYIGHKKYERIGQFSISDFLFVRRILDIVMDEKNPYLSSNIKMFEDKFEILYREFDEQTGIIRIVAISDLFNIIDRNSQIPYYDIKIVIGKNRLIKEICASMETDELINKYLKFNIIEEYELPNEKIKTSDKG